MSGSPRKSAFRAAGVRMRSARASGGLNPVRISIVGRCMSRRFGLKRLSADVRGTSIQCLAARQGRRGANLQRVHAGAPPTFFDIRWPFVSNSGDDVEQYVAGQIVNALLRRLGLYGYRLLLRGPLGFEGASPQKSPQSRRTRLFSRLSIARVSMKSLAPRGGHRSEHAFAEFQQSHFLHTVLRRRGPRSSVLRARLWIFPAAWVPDCRRPPFSARQPSRYD
jgi:hypothetical protein